MFLRRKINIFDHVNTWSSNVCGSFSKMFESLNLVSEIVKHYEKLLKKVPVRYFLLHSRSLINI